MSSSGTMASAGSQQTRGSVYLAVVLLHFGFLSLVTCQSTPRPLPCSTFTSCDSCVVHPKCLWCFTSNNCSEYPVSWLLPPSSICQLSQARWGVCWLNFEALIIVMAVLGGVLIISVLVCCFCCCCCCKRSSSGPDRDEDRLSRRREENKQRAEERKAERRARHDDIRRKYGLLGDAEHPYSKLENE